MLGHLFFRQAPGYIEISLQDHPGAKNAHRPTSPIGGLLSDSGVDTQTNLSAEVFDSPVGTVKLSSLAAFSPPAATAKSLILSL